MRALLLGIVAFTLFAGVAAADDDDDRHERDDRAGKTSCDKQKAPKVRTTDGRPALDAGVREHILAFVPDVSLTTASASSTAGSCQVTAEGTLHCTSSGSSA